MKKILAIFVTLAACCGMASAQQNLESDTFTTGKGRKVTITFIKHGTLMLQVDNSFTIHVDPVSMFGTDYSKLPKADLLLVTHEHGDHYDKSAVEAVTKGSTLFVSNTAVSELSKSSAPILIGHTFKVGKGINITATPAYNCSEGKGQFHPKGRDVGFIIKVDDLRIYIAGDTEDIPELAELEKINVAFLPVNQPYTMTPDQCIKAIEMFNPQIVYPYHYSDTDLTPIVEHFKGSSTTEIRIRQLQ